MVNIGILEIAKIICIALLTALEISAIKAPTAMEPIMQTTEHRLELLNDAFGAHTRCELAGEARWTRDYNPARTESRLFDAALACGMSYDEPSVSEWAAGRLTRWLVEA